MNRTCPDFFNYKNSYREACLQLFDENCPKYFAENERQDYANYLDGLPKDYNVAFSEQEAVAAFGLSIDSESARARINWIMVRPDSITRGAGSQMMAMAIERASNAKVKTIDIAASTLSAPFFKKFGAKETGSIEHGWGSGMHRVDMELAL